MIGSERKNPVLIAGPTASGKSSLALRIAALTDGVIVNADSMQVYDVLRVLTARPSRRDEARLPHRLYGHVSPAHAYSTGQYLKDAEAALSEIHRDNRRAIIVGGTGLYFKALLEGLSPIPAIPADIRDHWRQRGEADGGVALHTILSKRDPVMAARLAPGDRQRVIRALEVLEATGQSLSVWQTRRGQPLVQHEDAVRLVALPDRADLYRRAEARFETMIGGGAVEEVRQLMDMQLSPGLPAMRAIGVGPISAMLQGLRSPAAALEAGQLETRQYIKRQLTWLRRYMITWRRLSTQQMESSDDVLISFIES